MVFAHIDCTVFVQRLTFIVSFLFSSEIGKASRRENEIQRIKYEKLSPLLVTSVIIQCAYDHLAPAPKGHEGEAFYPHIALFMTTSPGEIERRPKSRYLAACLETATLY